MSRNANNEGTSTAAEKPVPENDDVKFPPFPEPKDEDFEEDICEEERNHYKTKFADLNTVTTMRLHCTACDRHLGCSARNEARMRSHPLLRTLVCHTCHSFYNSGEFDKGDDGSELYCRWCGQGGQVYCCSDCPHVFCAKCIKRNLGVPKIKEIENTEDWKCFKCNSKSLWELRAVCWALLRYCDLKNKMAYTAQDPIVKDIYQKDCTVDHTDCCKYKNYKRREKSDSKRKDAEISVKKETENSVKKDVETSAKRDAENSANKAASLISKIPPTIQVKKFASINIDDSLKQEKKTRKRPASPKNKTLYMKPPMVIAPCARIANPITIPPVPKKIRLPTVNPVINPIRFQKDRAHIANYTRIRPKPPQVPLVLNNQFNGYNNASLYNNMVIGDNINLSLESLTQGLDMAAVARMSNNRLDDDVVCTPDFPLEPLCEVTEDITDDDVQCITPVPMACPKVNVGPPPPPLVPRAGNTLTDLSSDNIIQMTDNDVTVNAATGGLKFRVDPQTLSSNKMYRLPDGRIFAINANPCMPGGYSATIVAVTENIPGKSAPKGATYAAKLNAVSPQVSTSPPKPNRNTQPRRSTPKRNSNKFTKVTKAAESPRECDLNVSVEWYRFGLIDAVDALEYSLSGIQKLKKDGTTMYLRTRTIPEMRKLHRQLDRLINTSVTRFREIRDNLNKEMKQYVIKKMANEDNMGNDNNAVSDDDVEILNDTVDNDDPIFIDENSIDSNQNETTNAQEVDLTLASSEHNESGSKSTDQNDSFNKEALDETDLITDNFTEDITKSSAQDNSDDITEKCAENKIKNEDDLAQNEKSENNKDLLDGDNEEEINKVNGDVNKIDKDIDASVKDQSIDDDTAMDTVVPEVIKKVSEKNTSVSEENCEDAADKIQDIVMNDDKSQDAEISEEMIDNLLKDDSVDETDNIQNLNCLEIPEEFRET